MNEAVIALGSNIAPAENIERAKQVLRRDYTLVLETPIVRTKPMLFAEQPDFLNTAVLIRTPLGQTALKARFRQVEFELGRVRAVCKDGPRTIDLDIVVWNGQVVDDHVYEWEFLRGCVQQLLPDLDLMRTER